MQAQDNTNLNMSVTEEPLEQWLSVRGIKLLQAPKRVFYVYSMKNPEAHSFAGWIICRTGIFQRKIFNVVRVPPGGNGWASKASQSVFY